MAEFLVSHNPGTAIAAADDPDVLRRDADARREDLIMSLAALKRTVSDKLDVQKQAQRFLHEGKQRAEVAIDRVRVRAREHPGLLVGVAIGVVALLAVGVVVYRRSQPPRWRRQLEAYRRALSENVYVRIGRPDAVDTE